MVMYIVTRRMMIENTILKLRRISRIPVGIGMIMTPRMEMTRTAKIALDAAED
jgi:hypothetical protein